jgi:hypothetical protein
MDNFDLHSFAGINQYVKVMNGFITTDGTVITSHVLGLFFIKGCLGLSENRPHSRWSRVVGIVNRHISKGRAGLLPCQKDLIEAGLVDFAQI